jgi:hypothetical protein
VADSFDSCLKTINVEVVFLRVSSLHTGTGGELWTRVLSAREWFDKTLQQFSHLTPPASLSELYDVLENRLHFSPYPNTLI